MTWAAWLAASKYFQSIGKSEEKDSIAYE